MIGDRLFTLSERDIQARWLDTLNLRQATLGLNLVLTHDFFIPVDRAYLWGHAYNTALGGGAQLVVNLAFYIVRPDFTGANQRDVMKQEIQPNPARREYVSNALNIVVPGGWTIRSEATFSAAAANNLLHSSIFGMLIPIGNIERG